MEEEERQRANQEAMAMLEEPEVGKTVESMMDSSSNNMQDVHFRNLDFADEEARKGWSHGSGWQMIQSVVRRGS